MNRFSIVVLLLMILVSGMITSVLSEEVTRYENFTLTDVEGKQHSLSDFKEAPAIVIMFIATRCPVSNAYNSRMAELYRDYAPQKVAFIGINSNKTEDVAEIKKHAEENNLEFLILKDSGNKIADRFKAEFTPEIFVLDSRFRLLYHGRIDDSRRIENVKSMDLRVALDEILAGKKVSQPETKAFGCSIKRVAAK